MFIIMHFHDHSRRTPLFVIILSSLFVIILITCGLCFIWQPSFVGNYSACCSRHSIYTLFNRFISHIDNKLNQSDQTEVSSLKDFSQESLHFHLFLSSPVQRFILPAIDLFVVTLAISFVSRTFSPSTRSVSYPISLEKLSN